MNGAPLSSAVRYIPPFLESSLVLPILTNSSPTSIVLTLVGAPDTAPRVAVTPFRAVTLANTLLTI